MLVGFVGSWRSSPYFAHANPLFKGAHYYLFGIKLVVFLLKIGVDD